MLYALFTTSGKIVNSTVSNDFDTTNRLAYDYLYRRADWPAEQWKNWEGFIAERKRRRWFIRQLQVTAVGRKR